MYETLNLHDVKPSKALLCSSIIPEEERETMNKLIAAVLSLVVLAASAGMANAANLGLTTSTPVVEVGNDVDVDLVVSGLDTVDLGTYDITITFDSALFSFNDVVFGNQLGYDPDPLFTDSDAFATPGIGDVSLTEISFLFDLSFQPDAFTLATLNFNTLAMGTGAFDIDFVILGDDFGDPVDFVITDNVNITAVPEPASMVLAAMGLFGIGIRSRRKK